jgi:hypothetical protein
MYVVPGLPGFSTPPLATVAVHLVVVSQLPSIASAGWLTEPISKGWLGCGI